MESEKWLKRCEFGLQCQQLNDEEHIKTFNHSAKSWKRFKWPAPRKLCRYGTTCYNYSVDHAQNFYHPDGQANKPKCKFGNFCKKKGDEKHLENYVHEEL